MGAKLGPRIVVDNLVLALDCADAKSYPGEPTRNYFINTASTGGWWGDGSNQTIGSKGVVAITDENLKYNGYPTVLWTPGSGKNAYLNGSDDIDTSATSTEWTFSVYAKYEDGTDISSMSVYLYYPSSDGSAAGTITDAGNGWKRISRTRTGSSNYIGLAGINGILSNKKIYLSGWQLEKKQYPTPAVGISSSRSAITSFLIHGNVGTGTSFEDSSPNKITVSNQNSVSHGGTSNFGGSAIQFSSSSSQQLTSASTDIINFGTGDWTIEFWFNMTNGSTARMHALSCGPGSTNNIDFNFNDSYAFWLYWNSGGSPNIRFGNDGDYGDGNWHHLMATRASGVVRVWVDGVHKGSNNYSSSTSMGQTASIYVGGKSGVYWDGFLDEIRIIKGTALWSGSGNFAVPTERFKNGAWLDTSGNENNGNFINEVGTGTSHYRVGDVIYPAGTNSARYLDFDGSDDYINISHNSAFDTNTFTIEIWFKSTTDDNTHDSLITRNGDVYTSSNGWSLGKLRNGLGSTTNALRWLVWGTSTYTDLTGDSTASGNWTQAVGVSDGTNLYLYQNGVQKASGSKPTGNIYPSSYGFKIGANKSSSDLWNGQIAAVKFYSDALSAAEVLQNYNSTKSRFS